jgi:hypothetical protein
MALLSRSMATTAAKIPLLVYDTGGNRDSHHEPNFFPGFGVHQDTFFQPDIVDNIKDLLVHQHSPTEDLLSIRLFLARPLVTVRIYDEILHGPKTMPTE